MQRPGIRHRRLHKRSSVAKRQLELNVASTARAASFILEQNRLLQRDNAALIKQLARLREELDAVKPKPAKKPAKPVVSPSSPSSAAKPRTAGKRATPAKGGKR